MAAAFWNEYVFVKEEEEKERKEPGEKLVNGTVKKKVGSLIPIKYSDYPADNTRSKSRIVFGM